MAQKTAQLFFAHANASGTAPRRTVFEAVTRSLVAPLLWLARANQRSRMKIRMEDLPSNIRRDLGFRENSGQSSLREANNVRFPDWS